MVNAAKIIMSLLEDHGFNLEDLGLNSIAFYHIKDKPNDRPPDWPGPQFIGCRYFLWDEKLRLAVIHPDDYTKAEFVADLNDPNSIQAIEEFLCQFTD